MSDACDRGDRPRPTPDGSARAAAAQSDARSDDKSDAAVETVVVRDIPNHVPPPRGQLTRVELQPSQVVAAAGTAIVTAARVGRLLGRSGWRLARQLPGARTIEREAQRIQHVVANEAGRMLQPDGVPRPPDVEQRAAAHVRTAAPDPAPLRSAMSELLERSVEATRTDSREYLYGTIMSQLVPDEARILAAMAAGTWFAAVDVVLKHRRGSRMLLAHASAVGRQAGLVSPDNTPTYLTRLNSFGLVEFGPPDDRLSVQYDILATDATVQNARESVEGRRRGSVRLIRKTVGMSAFGREFWAASDPSRLELK